MLFGRILLSIQSALPPGHHGRTIGLGRIENLIHPSTLAYSCMTLDGNNLFFVILKAIQK